MSNRDELTVIGRSAFQIRFGQIRMIRLQNSSINFKKNIV